MHIHFARRVCAETSAHQHYCILSAGLDLQLWVLFFQTNAVWFFARRGAEINIQNQLSPRGARHMINLTQQLEALFSSRLGVGPRLKL